MNKKRLTFSSICGAFFVLAVLSAMLQKDVWCRFFTSVFWTLLVLKMRSKMLKRLNPVMGNMTALGMLLLGYTAVFFLVMGFGGDMAELVKGMGIAVAGLFSGIREDFAGLLGFPLRKEMVYTIQSVWEELKKAWDILPILRTGNLRGVLAAEWRYSYLLLMLASLCLLLNTAMRCILSALAALWKYERKEARLAADTG